MRMVGGARKGYCSKLSRMSVETPRSTIRIEITIATIGRRMKNWATDYSAFAVPAGVGGVADAASGLTCIPGRTFWPPSTMTRSPGLTPLVAM